MSQIGGEPDKNCIIALITHDNGIQIRLVGALDITNKNSRLNI